MKLNIKPFREFWIDCFSTSIFSILISKTSIDKVFVYNNNYTYTESRIDFLDGSKAWSIMPQINMSEVTEKVLTDITYLDFKEKRDPISLLKMLLLKEKIVFLGVDVYYWIPDNFHWHRNHFNHYSVLNGFDEEKKIFYVLETGAMGYKEYEIKEEELLLAIRGYTGNGSIIAKINSNMESAPYSYYSS